MPRAAAQTDDTAGRRRGRPGYDLESLLVAAATLFHERGYDGTSMEHLSQRLGITKSAIYHHVPSKQELLRLAVDRALDGLFAEAAKLPDTGPAVVRLEQLVRGSVAVLVERLPFVTLLLRVRGNTPVERAALARRREFDRVVTDLVTRAVAEGDLRADLDPATTTRLLFGMVNSITEWYRPRGGTTAAALADTVVAVAFEGVRTRPAVSEVE
ncbi:TetR/AcrR family transcriptional regulator [Actinokineospora bangkokensis]|uniref:TetR family transcriptional regulator n=1 Tax=Actinokineospora bangkokensis TaxID=1193682 RepID=A0A1Q9LLC6_9PSEU|nr:TetR/AcrR family transcriptional regulator [Actinokineospora bangkokensis]OLR92838.1 TetR family transcriptional regulator [Actinokineospora bangkokensis]